MLLVGCAHHPPVLDCLESDRAPTYRGKVGELADRTIASVHVTGADPALTATLMKAIETRPGESFANAQITDDIRRMWAVGVLADVSVSVAGDELTYAVTRQPLIDRVTITGDARDDLELRRIRVLPGTPYEPTRLARTASYIEQQYVHDGYLDAKVEIKRGATGVCVAANHGHRITIRTVAFAGQRDVDVATLEKEIHGGPDLNHAGGIYDADLLAPDILRIKGLYWHRGKANVEVREPKLERHGDTVDLTIPIVEGPTFHYGPIKTAWFRGRTDELWLREGQQFDREEILRAITHLEEQNPGASVSPGTHLDLDTNTISITFELTWNHPWQMLGLLPQR